MLPGVVALTALVTFSKYPLVSPTSTLTLTLYYPLSTVGKVNLTSLAVKLSAATTVTLPVFLLLSTTSGVELSSKTPVRVTLPEEAELVDMPVRLGLADALM